MSLSGNEAARQGDYAVGQKIGSGSAGVVSIAESPNHGQSMVVKILHPELCLDRDAVARYFADARKAAATGEPGIVPALDMGYTAGGRAFVASERVSGETLEARLVMRGSLSPAEIADLASQVSSVLRAAHQVGLSHRALKPDNIMLVGDPFMPSGERVRITDFGISAVREAAKGKLDQTRDAAYLSPEQCFGSERVDHRADQYALGCILYRALNGRPPFVGKVGEVMTAHITKAPSPVFDASVPKPLVQFVMRLLQKSAENRFSSMAEAVGALTSVRAAVGIQPEPMAVRPRVTLPPPMRTAAGPAPRPPALPPAIVPQPVAAAVAPAAAAMPPHLAATVVAAPQPPSPSIGLALTLPLPVQAVESAPSARVEEPMAPAGSGPMPTASPTLPAADAQHDEVAAAVIGAQAAAAVEALALEEPATGASVPAVPALVAPAPAVRPPQSADLASTSKVGIVAIREQPAIPDLRRSLSRPVLIAVAAAVTMCAGVALALSLRTSAEEEQAADGDSPAAEAAAPASELVPAANATATSSADHGQQVVQAIARPPAAAPPTVAASAADPVAEPTDGPALRANGAVDRPVGLVSLVIESDPPGADVVRQRDGVRLGVTPYRFESEPTGGSMQFQVTKSGYRSVSVSMPGDRDGIRQVLLLPTTGAAQEARGASPALASAPRPTASSAPATTDKEARIRQPTPRVTSTARPAAAATKRRSPAAGSRSTVGYGGSEIPFE